MEYWTESDIEIDEDIEIKGAHIPPPDILDVQESQEKIKLPYDCQMDYDPSVCFSNSVLFN